VELLYGADPQPAVPISEEGLTSDGRHPVSFLVIRGRYKERITPTPALSKFYQKMTDHKADSALSPWQKFEKAMRHIVSVPHSEIKAKLDAEKKVRDQKRTRKSKVRAFREANSKK
jgi:hypothetical protein